MALPIFTFRAATRLSLLSSNRILSTTSINKVAPTVSCFSNLPRFFSVAPVTTSQPKSCSLLSHTNSLIQPTSFNTVSKLQFEQQRTLCSDTEKAVEKTEQFFKDPPLDGEEPEIPEHLKKIIDEVCKLNLLELVLLTKQLQKKLGVTDAMLTPTAVAAAPAAAGGGADSAEESKAEEKESAPVVFKVVLTKYENKIQVLKKIREMKGLGLVEVKKLVDNLPAEVSTGLDKEAADKEKEELEKIGATIELKE